MLCCFVLLVQEQQQQHSHTLLRIREGGGSHQVAPHWRAWSQTRSLPTTSLSSAPQLGHLTLPPHICDRTANQNIPPLPKKYFTSPQKTFHHSPKIFHLSPKNISTLPFYSNRIEKSGASIAPYLCTYYVALLLQASWVWVSGVWRAARAAPG